MFMMSEKKKKTSEYIYIHPEIKMDFRYWGNNSITITT